LSNEVNKLAVDLASFTNFSGGAEGASQALTKALLGERESVKSLGISILETDVQARVLQNTQKGLTFESERQAKAYATLQLAQEQSKNAIGDYARTSGSFANQMRLLQARVSDLGSEFGKILLPIAQKLVKVTQRVVKWFTDLDERTKTIITVVAGLVATIGPLLVVIGGIASALPAILTGLAALTGPVGLVIAAIGALTAIIISNWDTVVGWANDIANYFIELYNDSIIFKTGVELLIGFFKSLFDVGKFVFGALVTIVKTNFKVLKNILVGFGDVLRDVFTFNFGNLQNSIKKFSEGLASDLGNGIAKIASDAQKLWDDLGDNATEALNKSLSEDKLEPIDLKVSKESKEEIKEDVAEAVKAGVAKGFARQTSGNIESEGAVLSTNPLAGFEPEAITPITQVSNQMLRLIELSKNLSTQLNISTGEALNTIMDFAQQMQNVIGNNLVNAFSNLGDAIGNAFANGQNVFAAMGQSLLRSFGNFLSEMGDLLIQYGLFAKAKGKLDLAVAAGGFASIVAGAAGVAVGVLLKAAGAAISSRADQGLGGGGGTGATATSGGVDNNFSQSFSANREIILRVRGRDLVAVLNNQTNFNNAVG
jgi:hypothetical protein